MRAGARRRRAGAAGSSAASATCCDAASGSEYTATERSPRRRAVRITRQAISPRLATSTLPRSWRPITFVRLLTGGYALTLSRGDGAAEVDDFHSGRKIHSSSLLRGEQISLIMRTRLLLACSLFSLAAYLRMRHGSSTLAELRLASPARAPPTKFLVLMMKGRVGSVWLRDLLMANPEILVRHEGLPDQPSARAREMATRRVRRFLDDPASVVWGATRLELEAACGGYLCFCSSPRSCATLPSTSVPRDTDWSMFGFGGNDELSEEKIQRLKEAFNAFDTDGSGTVRRLGCALCLWDQALESRSHQQHSTRAGFDTKSRITIDTLVVKWTT